MHLKISSAKLAAILSRGNWIKSVLFVYHMVYNSWQYNYFDCLCHSWQICHMTNIYDKYSSIIYDKCLWQVHTTGRRKQSTASRIRDLRTCPNLRFHKTYRHRVLYFSLWIMSHRQNQLEWWNCPDTDVHVWSASTIFIGNATHHRAAMLGGVCLRCRVVCRSVRLCRGSPVIQTVGRTHTRTDRQTDKRCWSHWPERPWLTGPRWLVSVNVSRPRQNGRHFPDDTCKCIFLNESV